MSSIITKTNTNTNNDNYFDFDVGDLIFNIRDYCEKNGFKLLDLYDGKTYSNFIKFCRYNSSEPINQ
tara:strand:+ start:106 stop:306 length:201 start_codon:yes stop_codon:yes gene_type:complete